MSDRVMIVRQNPGSVSEFGIGQVGRGPGVLVNSGKILADAPVSAIPCPDDGLTIPAVYKPRTDLHTVPAGIGD